MRCKVCGRELDPQKGYCDKCGSRIEYTDRLDTEFAWNTIDFPKPKKPQDIEMVWPEMQSRNSSYMANDASEGFIPHAGVNAAQKYAQQNSAPRAAEPVAPAPAPAPTQAQYANTNLSWTVPNYTWTMPVQQQVVVPQPYYVQPVQAVQPVQTVQPIYVAPQVQTAPIQPVFVQTPAQPQAPIQTQQIVQQAPVQTQQTVSAFDPSTLQRPEKTETVNVDTWLDEQLKTKAPQEAMFSFTKQGAEFQKELDAAYEKYRTKFDIKLEDTADLQKTEIAELEENKTPVIERTQVFSAEKLRENERKKPVVKAQEDLFASQGSAITDFDQMIINNTKDADSLGEATLAISSEQLKKEIDEVAQKVEEAYGGPAHSFKEDRQKKLDAMAAAREAFFAAADVVLTDAKEDEAEKEVALAITEKIEESETSQEESKEDVNTLFEEWDKEQEKKQRKKKHGFGRFLFFILILLVLLFVIDWAVITYMPDSPLRDFFFNFNAQAYTKIEEIITQFSSKTN